ncbi:MAG: AAA family ATPase [Moraxellaceae bacterium]|nr:AAA family ATPase [Pseudobdellovibrionaceae bacterium]
MNKNDFQRIVIIGNSGSGKSHLSKLLSDALKNKKIIHLDEYFWEPGGFNKKRPSEIVHAEIKQLSLRDSWIMEGVFGDLAANALEHATVLIFLNKLWDECKTALEQRGSQSATQLDPAAAEASFKDLLSWAKGYNTRENSRSLIGHSNLYEHFTGKKYKLSNREEVASFLSGFKVL